MKKNLKNINAGDLNVSYFEAGSRKGLPVILLHGFPYDIHAYKEVVPLLISSCRIIIPYLRGYGHTVFLKNYTLRSGQQAALGFDLLKLMDALKIDKAIFNVANGNFEASDYGQYSFMAYGGGSMVLDEGLVPSDIVNAVKAKESEILDGLFRVNVNDARPKSDG